MKNKIKTLLSIIIIFFFNIPLNSEEINYSSNTIKILQNGKIISGEGDVQILVGENIFISSEKFEYNKETGLYKIFNDVQFKDNLNNINASGSEFILSTFDNKILSKTKSKIIYNEIYNIDLKSFEYDITDRKISSNEFTKIEDDIDNYFELYEFLFDLKTNKFLGKELKFIDNQQNKYLLNEVMINTDNDKVYGKDVKFFDNQQNKYLLNEVMINTENDNLYGKDLNIEFNKSLFGNSNNDPRLKAKSVKIKDQSSFLKKGVFTSCSKDNDCPPWSMYAEEIEHNKINKTINYKNAWLKIYDRPVVYFPKFSHPDPTVERKSGFLPPTFSSSRNIGSSVTIPYFHVLSENKDMTFKPKVFFNNEIVLQNEYRQENKNSSHIADFSIALSDFLSSKNTTKSHFFSNSKFDLSNDTNQGSIELNLENVRNDEYLKVYKIESDQIDIEKNTLHSYLSFDAEKNDIEFYTSLEVYEDLSKDKQSRHEFIYPNYTIQKKILSEKGNDLVLKSYGNQRKYDTNVYEGIIINDLEFNTFSKFSNKGLVTNYKVLFKNTNTDSKNSNSHKDKFEQALSTVMQYNMELPLKKESTEFINNFTPKVALMYSPNKSKNLSSDNRRIDASNIYSINRIANNETVEGGASLTYGTIFNKINKENNQDIYNFEISSLLRIKENPDLPISSSIGKKTSDIFGNLEIYPDENLSFKYNFSIDNNFNKTNYDSISTKFKINKFVTSFEYSDEKNNLINESFTSNSSSFEIDKNNSFNFNVRRNNEKSATEFYNLIYNYKNDCLLASIKFNKEFYKDSDLKPEKEIFFTLSLIPFGGVTTEN
ncbi:LPS-assembly protein LptD [Candidatus Pelagibacter ubique]|uniref:LPS-assembly protein LptD n=1 Tax=Pelagibacter ubique TaxID=198252 RepID=UPI0003D1B374